jgi:hypothetical protein
LDLSTVRTLGEKAGQRLLIFPGWTLENKRGEEKREEGEGEKESKNGNGDGDKDGGRMTARRARRNGHFTTTPRISIYRKR